MRRELNDALTRAWQTLGARGVWWSGEERLLIAREARAARDCALCRARKEAAIPQAVAATDQKNTPHAMIPRRLLRSASRPSGSPNVV